MDLSVYCGRVGDAGEELEELRRTDDGIGHRPRAYALLLGELAPHVPGGGQSVGPDIRQDDVVADPSFRLRGDQVTGRVAKERKYVVGPGR